MKTFVLSDEDAEYLAFILDDILVRFAENAGKRAEFASRAHKEYALGAESRRVDRLFLEADRESILFLTGLRDRFVPETE